MIVIETIDAARRAIHALRKERRKGESASRVGFVPTMGYLHEGHASLIQKARVENEIVAVSIFVNPLQFGPNEDLARYPRSPKEDQTLCESLGVDVLFTPSVEAMYGHDEVFTRVHVDRLGDHLCGASRPGHFDGVCTVVSKLFHIIEPDAAYFGQKDAQQLRIIEQMVQDLSLPIEIVPCPIVREQDGLAKSSRNAYLSPAERKIAPEIYRTLQMIKKQIEEGEHRVLHLQREAIDRLQQFPGFKVDYLSFVDAKTLTPVDYIDTDRKILLAVAVYVGSTRLIDNVFIT
ncbi:pantoate--beta-alanine ligase [Sulfoacidibacillus thermotolerans]|uniref:Pantothenate synthetase n=1 Tax=Sulfoacidibacillus thermotolerans TaxID=1765684 RepID=A0A2U3D742_SULT2|nr:pantoate--beta-alanine ligase [Sulfoacidibacillus thermotolerans]PWI57073.1 pantoate--beta-alanine ligase [Sulfoacidibacillus thermotolerans]